MIEEKLTELEFLLLNVLVATGPNHPYRLGREVEERGGKKVVTLGGLYKALHRLEEAGYVESEWEDVDPTEVKRPRRRIYKITGTAEPALARERARVGALYGQKVEGLAWEV
jgi:DNA-binding PadR family transcriptional regulator